MNTFATPQDILLAYGLLSGDDFVGYSNQGTQERIPFENTILGGTVDPDGYFSDFTSRLDAFKDTYSTGITGGTPRAHPPANLSAIMLAMPTNDDDSDDDASDDASVDASVDEPAAPISILDLISTEATGGGTLDEESFEGYMAEDEPVGAPKPEDKPVSAPKPENEPELESELAPNSILKFVVNK